VGDAAEKIRNAAINCGDAAVNIWECSNKK